MQISRRLYASFKRGTNLCKIQRFGKFSGERELKEMPHDNVYLHAFQSNSLAGWNSWINAHLKLGNFFYILPQSLYELNQDTIPEGFNVLEIEDPKDDRQLNRVFEEITKALNIRADELIKKDKHSIQLIAYAGYAAASAVQQLSSDEQVLGVFASNNYEIIKRLFDTKGKVQSRE
jgi:hypothetical protein